MDLTFTAEQEAFRDEARAWLAAHVPAEPLPSLDTAAGFAAHRAWERTLADDRWSVVSWPTEYGGRDVGIMEWLVFEEEYYRARAPKRVSQNGIFLLAPTMLEYGTPEQKARFLPPMASGEEIWCQGWSEPDAGSDLAGIRSRAVRNAAGDGWLLSGQKTWASRGAFAEWCFGIFRTDPDAERHRGLTYFLIAMDSPGVTVRPIPQIDGETGFAEIFFDNVEVPDDQVLGNVGAGWSVAMATAGSERGLSLRSPARYTEAAGRLLDLFDQRGGPPSSADAMAQAHMDAQAYKLHTYWTASKVARGHAVGPEASCNKIFWSETDVAIHEAALTLLGPEAEVLESGSPGTWLDGYLFALAGPIYAGTNEIQRNVVAERLLGLPEGLKVDFAFSDEQVELRQAVRQVLDAECPVGALRAFDRAPSGQRSALARARWGVLSELGAPALLVPEAAGGLGLSDVDLVGVLEEAGWAALPEPLLETAGLAAPLLATLLPAPAAADALAALLADHATFAIGGFDVGAAGLTSPTTVSADGMLHTPRVVAARDAAVYLLACRDPDSGWQLHAVPAASCVTDITPALDSTRDLATVHWPLSSDTLLAYGVAADAVVGLLADRAAAGTAAYLVGLADRMITMAADYAKDRHQFGKPIGSFQAVKHLLANARVRLEFARPATYRAAWSLATAQSTVSHDASMAKALAADAADLAARVALQVHGAIGYTWECDLHFFMKRTWALSKAWGDAPTHRLLVLGEARRQRTTVSDFRQVIVTTACHYAPVIEDPDRCYQAAHSKDARFDGVFFIGVTSTGVYCRPSCPARTPKRENVRFYASAAAAQQAGFRACLRCRPDATPGSPEWNMRADVVARAMRLIRDGIVDREGVDGLARRLGYSVRQLNRLVTAEIGTGPLAIARAQRSQTARVLLETTDLPIAHVAFAAGFSSVRQCNETVQQIFAVTPSGLRSRISKAAARRRTDGATQGIRLRLPCRRPFSPESVVQFLGTRAVPGIEAVDGTTYRRSLRLPHGHGVVGLSAGEHGDNGPMYVDADLHLSDLRDLTTAVSRCRQLLDLDADPLAVLEALRGDPLIGPLVTAHPGRRVPGAVDGFELAVRAVIGQQVSVPGARTVAGRLVLAAGELLPAADGGITRLFPTPDALIALAERDPAAFSMPTSRRRALVALAEAVKDGMVVIDPGADPTELRAALVELPGIGPWTAEYVAMRALRDPDAFMPTDLGIRRAAQALGLPDDPAHLAAADPRVAALAQLRHGPPMVDARTNASGQDTSGEDRNERKSRRMTTLTYTAPMDTPIGRLVLESDGDVLIGIWLPTESKVPRGKVPRGKGHDAPPVLKDTATQLEEYFAGERTEFDVPMELDGTTFQKEVWTELTRIPYGETISYGELARRVGRPKGPRAVGQANGRNPIPIIVPCHRVLASNGIGGYGGGLPMKRALLAVEGVTA